MTKRHFNIWEKHTTMYRYLKDLDIKEVPHMKSCKYMTGGRSCDCLKKRIIEMIKEAQ